jgi:hypothetical protein
MIFFETALLTAIHGQHLSSWQIQHQGIQLNQAFFAENEVKCLAGIVSGSPQ